MKPGTRVPIVEDDRSIAELVQLELEHRGMRVRCAYDGPSGLAAVEEFEPSVVVLDIMLPDMDGVGVLKRLRQRGDRVPVIMLAAVPGVHYPTDVAVGGAYFLYRFLRSDRRGET